MRGFRTKGLGPRAPGNQVASARGGDAYFTASATATLPLPSRLLQALGVQAQVCSFLTAAPRRVRLCVLAVQQDRWLWRLVLPRALGSFCLSVCSNGLCLALRACRQAARGWAVLTGHAGAGSASVFTDRLLIYPRVPMAGVL